MGGVHAFGEVYSNEGNLGVQNTRKVPLVTAVTVLSRFLEVDVVPN